MNPTNQYDEAELIPIRIIEKNNAARIRRQTEERREELARVLRRVKNIYADFDRPSLYTREFSSITDAFMKSDEDQNNVEYVEDVEALEDRIKSKQWRSKHVKQVTVFIVGYSQVASDRLRILQEVNQFLLTNEDTFDSFLSRSDKISKGSANQTPDLVVPLGTEVDYSEEPDYSLGELSASMDDALSSCRNLTERLGQLNVDMIDCFVKYVQNKAGNKGRKKLEKSLETALNDSHKLQEKLTETQNAITEKDTKIEALMKQIEAKTHEVLKYKTSAENIKKAALESNELRTKIKDQEQRIIELETELETNRFKVEEAERKSNSKLSDIEENTLKLQEENQLMEKVIKNQRMDFEEEKRSLKRNQEAEIQKLKAIYESKLEKLERGHKTEIEILQEITTENQSKLLSKVPTQMSSEFDENAVAVVWSDSEPDSEHMDQRPSPSISPDKEKSNETPEENQPTNQDSNEDVMEFSDAPHLDDEDFWSSVPRNHLLGRFFQYRQLSRAELSALQDDMDSNQTTTKRQVQSLKAQHAAHRRQWDEEREYLIRAVGQTQEQRKTAQNLAESALEMTQHTVSEEDNSAPVNISGRFKIVALAQSIAKSIKSKDISDPILEDQIHEIIQRAKLLEDRTRISLPKFATMIDLISNKDRNNVLMKIASETQTEFGLDETMDILFPEDFDDTEKKDVAVSASPHLLKTGIKLIDHPIVCDYLQSYDAVLTFKENLLVIFNELSNVDPGDIHTLIEMKPIKIRSTTQIIPQIEEIGKSIQQILINSLGILSKLLVQKRITKKIPGSNPIKEKLQPTLQEKSSEVVKQKSLPQQEYFSYMSEEIQIMKNDLKKIQTSFLQKFNLMNNSLIYVSQLMRKLTHEIDDRKFNNKSKQLNKSSSVKSNQLIAPLSYDSISIIFTRKDSERNKKRMREEIINRRLDELSYQDAVNKMSDYVEIPAKRLMVLVKKYIHKRTMDKIASYVRRNDKFSKSTLNLLDGIENIHEKKVRRYNEILEYFRCERLLRAQALDDTLDKLQKSSPIILIRPIIGNKAKKLLPEFIEKNKIKQQRNSLKSEYFLEKIEPETGKDAVSIWKPKSSSNEPIIRYSLESRLAELDINRVLLPINNVSREYLSGSINALLTVSNTPSLPPNIAIRSYVAVTHPSTIYDGSTINDTASTLHARMVSTTPISKHNLIPPIKSLENNT